MTAILNCFSTQNPLLALHLIMLSKQCGTAQNPTRLILRVVYRMNFPTVLLQSTASHSQWQPIVYNPWQILFQTLISFQYPPLDGQELWILETSAGSFLRQYFDPKPCCRVDQVKIPSAISRVEEKRNFEITPKKKKERRGLDSLFNLKSRREQEFWARPQNKPKKRGKKRSEGLNSLLTYLQ